MTDSERQQLKQFEARVRQLLLQYKTLQAENELLNKQVGALNEQLETQGQLLSQLQIDYKTLKTARMIEVSDVDMKNAKQTISLLVREVNKCIGLLKAEQCLGSGQQPMVQRQDADGNQQERVSMQEMLSHQNTVSEPVFMIEPEPMPTQKTEAPQSSQPKLQFEIEELTLPFDQ